MFVVAAAAVLGVGGDDVGGDAAMGLAEEEFQEVLDEDSLLADAANFVGEDSAFHQVGEEVFDGGTAVIGFTGESFGRRMGGVGRARAQRRGHNRDYRSRAPRFRFGLVWRGSG